MPGRIYAIAINTFREAVRDRVLYAVLGFACAVLVFTLALAELSLNEQQRVVLDLGLASISMFSVLTAIFLGSSLLYKEIERKTLYVILPKPIHRWEFLVGKYAGIAMTASVFIAIMGAIQFLVAGVQAGLAWRWGVAVAVGAAALLGVALYSARDRTAVLLPWSLLSLAAAGFAASTTAVGVSPILAALVLTFLEVLVLTGVALLFSSFSTPFMTGAFSFGVWLVGRSAGEMATMRSRALSDEIKLILRGLAEVVPNYHLFVPGHHTLTSVEGGAGGVWSYVASTASYAVLYTAVALFAAALIFRRRDFL